MLKDTHANVRDAAVGLLITIRTNLNQSDVASFNDAITVLPKYRVSEIQKRISEIISPSVENPSQTEKQTMNKTMHEKASAKISMAPDQSSNDVGEDKGENAALKDKPKFATSFTERIRSAKGKQTQPGLEPLPEENFLAELLKGRTIAQEYMPIVKEILTDFGHMKQNNFAQVNAQSLDGKWDDSLR